MCVWGFAYLRVEFVRVGETLEERLGELIDHLVDSNAVLRAGLVVVHTKRASKRLRLFISDLALGIEIRLVSDDNENRWFLVAALDVDLDILLPVLNSIEGAPLGNIEDNDDSAARREKKLK